MSEAIVLAIIAAIVGPSVGLGAYLIKALLSDNKESWKQRAESSEAREKEMKDEVFPAVKDLVEGVKSLAAGQAEDRAFWKQALPALERVEKTLKHVYPKDERDEG